MTQTDQTCKTPSRARDAGDVFLTPPPGNTVNVPKLAPSVTYSGTRTSLGQCINDLMPRHLHFVVPYFRADAVLLMKDPLDPSRFWGPENEHQGTSEILNDVLSILTNFWSVMQHPDAFARFVMAANTEAVGSGEWHDLEARSIPTTLADVPAALAFFKLCLQSQAVHFRESRTSPGNRPIAQGLDAWDWLTCVEHLPAVYDRLRRIVILRDDPLKIIRSQDGEMTLFYVDPPFFAPTRADGNRNSYPMADADHLRLIETLKKCTGKVILAALPTPLYVEQLHDWNRRTFMVDTTATTKRRARRFLWTNYD